MNFIDAVQNRLHISHVRAILCTHSKEDINLFYQYLKDGDIKYYERMIKQKRIIRDMQGVYSLTNQITKQVYVGSSKFIISRFHNYNSYKLKNQCRISRAVFNSIKSFGKKNFVFEILNSFPLDTLTSKQLHKLEKKYIKTFFDLGYSLFNIQFNPNATLSPNGYEVPFDVNENDPSQKIELIGDFIFPIIGNKSCEEKSKALYESRKVPINQFDKDGNFQYRFDSIKEAALFNKVKPESIGWMLSKKSRKRHTRYFEYADSSHQPRKLKRKQELVIAKPVNQIDLNTGAVISSYQSITEAGKATKINQFNIGQCCKGRLYSAGKFGWQFQINK